MHLSLIQTTKIPGGQIIIILCGTGKYLSEDLIQTITFFFEESCCNTWFPPPELTLSEMQHWMSVPNPGPEMVRNYQRLEIILKINQTSTKTRYCRGPYFVNYEKCLLCGQLYLG